MSRKYGPSALWRRYSETDVTAATDLDGFRSGRANYKLALWNPQANGVRYLKALTYHIAANLSPENWARLRNVRNRQVGDPISVRYGGEPICLDYLQAVFELEFIAGAVDLDGLSVLEIGAGYGRTCHTVLSNHDVSAYHIVDLDNSLHLARRYLAAVLEEDQYAKLRFHPVDDLDASLAAQRFDLCLNVDSFNEMDAGTVVNYLAFVADRCRYFYVNNPVGKYLDRSLDNHSQGDTVVSLAMDTGLLRDIIDIHDSQAVAAQSATFTTVYRPGSGWRLVADGPAPVWSYYWQALYRRQDDGQPT